MVMTPTLAATATARSLSALGATFMSDPRMNKRGRELGFEGIDFYFAGRAGVLGEVNADVATAALVFFNPETVAHAWNRSAGIMPRRDTAVNFAACAAAWADDHLGDGVDYDELLALAERIVASAPNVLAPIFAGWRTLDQPVGTKRRVTHAMNALRELRMARHAAALLAHGVQIGDAVRHRQPTMTQLFGWDAGAADALVVERWKDAEALTDEIVGNSYAVLGPDELSRFVELSVAASRAVR